jgi:hypothetical protein
MTETFEEIRDRWEAEQAKRREISKKCLEKNKAVLLPILKAAGIVVVEVDYEGASDSGQINDVSAYTDDNEYRSLRPGRGYALPKEAVTIELANWDGSTREYTSTVDEVIRELCWDLLEQEHAGWENNDGGRGTFTFYVGDELKIELDHVDYFTHEEHSSHEW